VKDRLMTFLIYKIMNKKRAQAWGFDLILGMVIFLFGIFVFFLFSLNYNSSYDSTLDELKYQGRTVGDSLLSEGFPRDWDKSDFNSGTLSKIGIMSNDSLDESKLKNLSEITSTSLSYNKTKNILNIKDEFYVQFNPAIGSINSIGRVPTNEKNLISVKRLVAYDSNPTTDYSKKLVEVDIQIWN